MIARLWCWLVGHRRTEQTVTIREVDGSLSGSYLDTHCERCWR